MTTEQQPAASEARTIERVLVDSSNLKSIGYDAARQVLAIEFLSSGHVLHYDNVPPELFEELCRSESRGKFYAREIKGKFTARPMTGRCSSCAVLGYIGERCQEEGCRGVVRAIDRVHKP